MSQAFRLYDAPGADVAQIETDGSTIKPFLNAIAAVVDECKLHVSDDGLSVRAVDPAMVFMGDMTLGADAFETFDVSQEATLGVSVGHLKSAVRRARKRSDDTLTLSLQEMEATATVERGYANHTVVSQNTVQLIDSKSIREEPDIPELDRDVSISVDTDPFTDALSHATAEAEHARFAVQGVNQHTNALYLGSDMDARSESIAISDIDTDDTAESIYSVDYLRSMLGVIGKVEPETVGVTMDDEFPMTIELESADMPLSVSYLIAPRVQSGE